MHFVIGAIFGLTLGFVFFGYWLEVPLVMQGLLITGVSLTMAILGAIHGDRFWTRLFESRLFRILLRWG